MLKKTLTLATILTMAAHGDPAEAPAKKDAPATKKEAKEIQLAQSIHYKG